MITARPGGHHVGSWRGVNAWCCTTDTSEMLGGASQQPKYWPFGMRRSDLPAGVGIKVCCHNHACPIVQYSKDKFRDLEVRDRCSTSR
jgi:hypothetical protein